MVTIDRDSVCWQRSKQPGEHFLKKKKLNPEWGKKKQRETDVEIVYKRSTTHYLYK